VIGSDVRFRALHVFQRWMCPRAFHVMSTDPLTIRVDLDSPGSAAGTA
jgi:hypothetical protein